MGPVTALPPPQRSVWCYEVARADPEGKQPTMLRITEEDGERRFEISFHPADLTLQSVIRIEDGEREELCEIAPREAYFGWTQSQPVIFDWPRFPARSGPESRRFRTANGLEVEQIVQSREQGSIEVVFTHKDKVNSETTYSRQLWTAGDPWWTNSSVEIEYTKEDGCEAVVRIKGNLIREGR
jgi:hypothetical protein